uniref:Terminase n=8 Tax=unclassified Caudoviricetes TaxID=2788787 RepID=A0AB39U1Y9_9CAUD
MMKPRKPSGLKAAGTRLWERVLATYDMDDYPEKLEALAHACRVADVIAQLEREAAKQPLIVLGSARQKTINPLISEVRFQRGLLVSLLSKLNFADEE